ncbi:MAG: crossover junction endodeoxyribonuclease RuvC [Chlamydiota bacterium]
MKRKNPTIILGIDPGTRVTGFGVLRLSSTIEAVDYGCIKLPTKKPLSYRYYLLFNAFTELITQHQPDEIAVEKQYLDQNFVSTTKLYGAKTALLIAAEQAKVPTAEYSATKAKKAVTGYGLASKEQLQKTLQNLLSLEKIPEPEDASDALSLAYCHANSVTFAARCMIT